MWSWPPGILPGTTWVPGTRWLVTSSSMEKATAPWPISSMWMRRAMSSSTRAPGTARRSPWWGSVTPSSFRPTTPCCSRTKASRIRSKSWSRSWKKRRNTESWFRTRVGGSKVNGDALPDCRLELLPELLDQRLMGGIDLGVGQGPLGVTVGEGVSQAFLARRHVLTAEDVEQLHGFEVGRSGLPDDAEHRLVVG